MPLQYPKTVVLRKTWILIVAILLIIIITLILNNLYQASHPSFHSSERDKIQIISNPTNTHWYQQQTVADVPKLPVSLLVPVVKQQDEFSAEDLKAMSEPISYPVDYAEVVGGDACRGGNDCEDDDSFPSNVATVHSSRSRLRS